MELKRIALVCNYKLLPNRIGGMDHFFFELEIASKKANIKIDWFFPNEDFHGHYQHFSIFANQSKSVEETFIEHLKNRPVKYDYILCHFTEICTSFYKQIKLIQPSCKILVVDHNSRPIKGYSLKKRISKKIKGRLYSRFIDLFIGVSKYSVRELIKDFGKQITHKTMVIYNGIKIDDIPTRDNTFNDIPRFLTASHLQFAKGLQDLILAIAQTPEQIRNKIKVDIYGDGSYKNKLQSLIESKNLESNFIFKGNTPGLNKIYSQYDYLLQPTHMECFSLAILESLCSNVPVITTPVGGNSEIIRDGINGLMLPVSDIQAWSKALTDIVNHKLTFENNLDKEIRSDFTLEKMVDNYLKLFS